jgi:hypothetical protein
VPSRPSLPWELYEQWIGKVELQGRITELSLRTDRDGLPERTRMALEAAEEYASGESSTERLG